VPHSSFFCLGGSFEPSEQQATAAQLLCDFRVSRVPHPSRFCLGGSFETGPDEQQLHRSLRLSSIGLPRAPLQKTHRQPRTNPRPDRGETHIHPVPSIADDRERRQQIPHAAPRRSVPHAELPSSVAARRSIIPTKSNLISGGRERHDMIQGAIARREQRPTMPGCVFSREGPRSLLAEEKWQAQA
jgi:hypothetical protein